MERLANRITGVTATLIYDRSQDWDLANKGLDLRGGLDLMLPICPIFL